MTKQFSLIHIHSNESIFTGSPQEICTFLKKETAEKTGLVVNYIYKNDKFQFEDEQAAFAIALRAFQSLLGEPRSSYDFSSVVLKALLKGLGYQIVELEEEQEEEILTWHEILNSTEFTQDEKTALLVRWALKEDPAFLHSEGFKMAIASIYEEEKLPRQSLFELQPLEEGATYSYENEVSGEIGTYVFHEGDLVAPFTKRPLLLTYKALTKPVWRKESC